MQSVCEENDRLENFLRPNNERRAGRLGSTDGKKKTRQGCSCKLKHNSTYTEISPKGSYFGMTSDPKWKVIFETESTSHHPTCGLFASSASSNMARVRMKSCGAFLAGAIEASISIVRGAGGLSISPALQCARVVPRYSPAFELVDGLGMYLRKCMYPGTGARESKVSLCGRLEALLDIRIHELAHLFRDGKASPYDVDLQGNTLLHVRVSSFAISSH